MAATVALPLRRWIRDAAAAARLSQGCGDASRLAVVHPRVEEDWAACKGSGAGCETVLGPDAVAEGASGVLRRHDPTCLRIAMDESAVRPSVRRRIEELLLTAAPHARLMTTMGSARTGAPRPSGGPAQAGKPGGAGAPRGMVASTLAARAVASLSGGTAELPYVVVSAVEYDHATSAGSLAGLPLSTFDVLAAVERLVGPDEPLGAILAAVQRASSGPGAARAPRAAWRLKGGVEVRECTEPQPMSCADATRQHRWFREA